jgi:hypothetical protein
MKRPELCLMKVEKCEDCKYWEPIPFHDKGGECIPPVEMSMVRLVPPVSQSSPERVPVTV